ncbi:MAG TPA: hypothetical protein VLA34_10560 [Candidatus Krumholzibacterium sp.]|nr:hypothetical protein [Candidatus Krumholzibacterium sp.]
MRRSIMPVLMIVLLLGAGCNLFDSSPSTPSSGTVAGDDAVDLDSPTGGFTTGDEEPAFGEPDSYSLMGIEPEYDDPVCEDGEVKACLENRHAKVFRLRAVWGQLMNTFRDTSGDTINVDCCRLDWSGGMSFEGGYIVIEKLIAFDAQDSVARIDRSHITWESRTCPHVDGIQVKLIVPFAAGNDSMRVMEVEPVLEFKAGQIEKSFTLAELEAMEYHQPIDRCGNGIMISSHIRPFTCPEGYLFGGWQSVEPDTLYDEETGEMRGVILGRYRGVWMAEHGMAAGFVRGVAGTNSIGENVIFGKYIDLQGRFKGIIRGTWTVWMTAEFAEYPPSGDFEGVWIGRLGGVKGRLKGNWISDEAGHGFFNGVWNLNCVED